MVGEPRAIVPRVIAAPLTAMPRGLLVMVVVVPPAVIGADAEIYVAPEESILTAFKLMAATPLEFVNAVAETGVYATSELAAVKVTTAYGTNAPSASLSVPVIVIGVPYATTLEEVLKARVPLLVVPVPVPAVLVMITAFVVPVTPAWTTSWTVAFGVVPPAV